MMNDPIVEEIGRIRDAHAAQFHYDLHAIYRDIKNREKRSGRTCVFYPPRLLAEVNTPSVPIAPPLDRPASPSLPTSPSEPSL